MPSEALREDDMSADCGAAPQAALMTTRATASGSQNNLCLIMFVSSLYVL
jgi:hypothetical protein